MDYVSNVRVVLRDGCVALFFSLKPFYNKEHRQTVINPHYQSDVSHCFVFETLFDSYKFLGECVIVIISSCVSTCGKIFARLQYVFHDDKWTINMLMLYKYLRPIPPRHESVGVFWLLLHPSLLLVSVIILGVIVACLQSLQMSTLHVEEALDRRLAPSLPFLSPIMDRGRPYNLTSFMA